MSVYVDTSALYAIMDRDDANHMGAKKIWSDRVAAGKAIVTSNYVIVEAMALMQRRLGMSAVHTLCDDVLPIMHLEWVAIDDHAAATAAILVADRRDLSFVDCASFQIMRRLGIREAFAFDPHFVEQGFSLSG